jgi:hypothetical protein
VRPTLSPEDVQILLAEIEEANTRFAKRYPGDSARRQPVHTELREPEESRLEPDARVPRPSPATRYRFKTADFADLSISM